MLADELAEAEAADDVADAVADVDDIIFGGYVKVKGEGRLGRDRRCAESIMTTARTKSRRLHTTPIRKSGPDELMCCAQTDACAPFFACF